MVETLTSRFETIRTAGGWRFVFFCDLCESRYESVEFSCECPEEAFILAAEEAQSRFNRCHRCGKWICDRHYNIDVMECTECAPE